METWKEIKNGARLPAWLARQTSFLKAMFPTIPNRDKWTEHQETWQLINMAKLLSSPHLKKFGDSQMKTSQSINVSWLKTGLSSSRKWFRSKAITKIVYKMQIFK